MIKITIPRTEYYDEAKKAFIYPIEKDISVKLEHSLISLQRWESKWHKPFLSDQPKTKEETLDYIRCMSINEMDDEIFKYVPKSELDRVAEYIEDSMTATWFSDSVLNNPKYLNKKKEVVTAEIIYYWMIALNIPAEYQKWHLNRLITLIKVINAKSNPDKKNKKDIFKDYDRLNSERRRMFNSKG